MNTNYKKQIEQNNEKIEKAIEQIKKLKTEVKKLKETNEQLNDALLLEVIKKHVKDGEDIERIIEFCTTKGEKANEA